MQQHSESDTETDQQATADEAAEVDVAAPLGGPSFLRRMSPRLLLMLLLGLIGYAGREFKTRSYQEQTGVQPQQAAPAITPEQQQALDSLMAAPDWQQSRLDAGLVSMETPCASEQLPLKPLRVEGIVTRNVYSCAVGDFAIWTTVIRYAPGTYSNKAIVEENLDSFRGDLVNRPDIREARVEPYEIPDRAHFQLRLRGRMIQYGIPMTFRKLVVSDSMRAVYVAVFYGNTLPNGEQLAERVLGSVKLSRAGV